MRVGVFSQEEYYGNPTGSRALPDDLKEKFEIKKSKKVSGNGHQNVCNCRTRWAVFFKANISSYYGQPD